ncbi:MAG: XamI family restriction endonuclease [Saprospiraceae bacterium]
MATPTTPQPAIKENVLNSNRNKPERWKDDIAKSVDFYNKWFLAFAPKAFRETRIETTKTVEEALPKTRYLRDISPEMLLENPDVVPMLRMSTCPPIARDRLIGLSGVPSSLVGSLESGRIPPRMDKSLLKDNLKKIGHIIERMADRDIFVWLNRQTDGTQEEIHRAATIIADRLCGAVADPIIRNAQEKRQLKAMQEWLEARDYRLLKPDEATSFDKMPLGTFSFRFNVPVYQEDNRKVNIPIDAVVMPKNASPGGYPLLIEAKSAGDFTNVNKRRKEEAAKMILLRKTYGDKIRFNLFLCGYFDSGYLGFEAAEGIDWVWEHRIDDLADFGL